MLRLFDAALVSNKLAQTGARGNTLDRHSRKAGFGEQPAGCLGNGLPGCSSSEACVPPDPPQRPKARFDPWLVIVRGGRRLSSKSPVDPGWNLRVAHEPAAAICLGGRFDALGSKPFARLPPSVTGRYAVGGLGEHCG